MMAQRNKSNGSFSVQGLIINGRFRALPILQITSETRKNIAELKLVSTG